MELFTWLSTPGGAELQHAVAILLIAVAGWITYRTHVRTLEVEDKVHKIQGQLDGHTQDVVGSQDNPESDTV